MCTKVILDMPRNATNQYILQEAQELMLLNSETVLTRVRTDIFISFQQGKDFRIALSGIPHQLQVLQVSMKHYSGLQPINVWGSYFVMLFNSQPVCCFPRLCASGLGYNSLHRGSAVPASYSSARVQTEGEFTVRKTYVLLMCTNSYTHTHT